MWTHRAVHKGLSTSMIRTQWTNDILVELLALQFLELRGTALTSHILENGVLAEVLVDLLVPVDLRSLASQPKVAQLGPAIVVDEDVGWLDVPVHDVGRVQVVQRAEDVVHDDLDVLLAEVQGLVVTQQLPQVGLLVVHHNEDVLE